MRKIIVFENVTVDGFMSGPNGEIDWALRDEEITEYTTKGQDSTGEFLFGRVTYQMMASFWPTPAAQAVNATYANILNSSPKYVISTSIEKADWQNTTVISELTSERITQLKEQDGKDILIFGSGTIVDQLTNLGLVDEFQLMVTPIILGKGKPLFKDLKSSVKLTLVEIHQFKNGVVFLQYRPVK